MTVTGDIAPDEKSAGRSVALRLAGMIRRRADAVVGVATGSSPEPVYAALADLVHDGLDASRVTWFALDEYLGLHSSHPQSYRSVLERALIRPLRLDPRSLRVPSSHHATPEESARRYERALRRTPVDVQLLGIGHNGHIGFNEPGTPFTATTHRATLSESTRQANSRYFPALDDVPRECLTQGIATILRARRIELIATGEGKAEAVARAARGPVTDRCPGSVLQTHPDARFTLDPAAAGLLQRVGSGAFG